MGFRVSPMAKRAPPPMKRMKNPAARTAAAVREEGFNGGDCWRDDALV
jgi:hypothetical protein